MHDYNVRGANQIVVTGKRCILLVWTLTTATSGLSFLSEKTNVHDVIVVDPPAVRRNKSKNATGAKDVTSASRVRGGEIFSNRSIRCSSLFMFPSFAYCKWNYNNILLRLRFRYNYMLIGFITCSVRESKRIFSNQFLRLNRWKKKHSNNNISRYVYIQ